MNLIYLFIYLFFQKLDPNSTDGELYNKSDRKLKKKKKKKKKKNDCILKCEYLLSAIAQTEFSETQSFLQTSLNV